jgi:hypothetical protein
MHALAVCCGSTVPAVVQCDPPRCATLSKTRHTLAAYRVSYIMLFYLHLLRCASVHEQSVCCAAVQPPVQAGPSVSQWWLQLHKCACIGPSLASTYW